MDSNELIQQDYIDNNSTNHIDGNLVLGIIIAVCVILGVVLGIFLGRKSATK